MDAMVCWEIWDVADRAKLDRILLYGPPGTGKTYAALTRGVGPQGVERLVCTEDLTAAEVTGAYLPLGDGRWAWQEGPALRAWRRGARLVVDEVDRASGDVLSLLLAMTDSDGSAEWHHPATGAVVRPAPGFSVVMTSNMVSLDEIPAALRDRFPVAIRIDRPTREAVQHLAADLRDAALTGSLGDADRRVSLRVFAAFDALRQVSSPQTAAQVLFGTRASDFLDALRISGVTP
jgi:MoxR-like ATPase